MSARFYDPKGTFQTFTPKQAISASLWKRLTKPSRDAIDMKRKAGESFKIRTDTNPPQVGKP